MKPKLCMIGNPRSGSCLFTFLLAAGFDLQSKFQPFYPSHESIFAYRVDTQKVLDDGASKSHYCVMIVKDPRDVTTSFHPRTKEKGYARDLDKWVVNYELSLQLDDKVHMLRVKYEDLVFNPSDTQDKIAAFLGLSIACPFNECHKHFLSLPLEDTEELSVDMGGVNPLLTTRVGRWKEEQHRERIKQQLAATPEIVDWLIELGYEKDNKWTEGYNV